MRRHLGPWAVAASSLILVVGGAGAPGPHPSAGAVPAGHGGRHRADLVGLTLDGSGALGRRLATLSGGPVPGGRDPGTVAVIVELAGETVDDRLGRLPAGTASETAVEQGLQAEQRRFDPVLAGAGAVVTGRLLHTVNAVTALVPAGSVEHLSRLAGVVAVQVARPVHRGNAMALTAAGVPTVWESLGLTGAGVTIGIIDDGIDYTHADFGGSGDPTDYASNDRTLVEPGTFPTAKVVGGYDFVGDHYDGGGDGPGSSVPVPDPDPLPCGVHGTHVAGTAAGMGVVAGTGATYTGPYDAATLAGVTFAVAPGVAPQALLRAYKVFGCDGESDDAVVVRAIDRAVADKVDVINLSLGEPLGTGSPTDVVVKAVNRASARGTLVVASAGNSGGAPYLVGSPSTATGALAVAALDAGPTTWPGVSVGTTPPVPGMEASEVSVAAPVTGPVAVRVPGCDAEDFADVSGHIVVVSATSGCVAPAFDRLDGVLAVVVVADVYQRLGWLGVDVPVVLVRQAEAGPLLAADGETVTLSPSDPVSDTGHGGLAPFSSGGPRRQDQVMKPDLTAPGVSLLSARWASGTGAAELSGTSMAAPVVAGVAALVVERRPTWTPAQVKAALMTTADPAGVADYSPRRAGTGLVVAPAATATATYLSTIDGRHSLGFGLSSISTGVNRVLTFRLTNTSTTAVTYTLSAQFTGPSYGFTAAVSPATVRVGPRSSRTLTLRLRLDRSLVPALPGAAASDHGNLTMVQGTVVATPVAPAPGVGPLRMAFSLVPKALSNVAPTRTRVRSVAGTGTIRVVNTGRHEGTADVFTWLYRDRLGDAPSPEIGDLRDIGVKSFLWDPDTGEEVGPDRQVVFALNTAKVVATQAGRDYEVVVDVDSDLEPDYTVVAIDDGAVFGLEPTGRMVSLTVRLADMVVVDAWDADAPLNGSSVVLRTMASSLGASGGSLPWSLFVVSATWMGQDTRFDDAPDDLWLRYHPFHPFISAGGSTAAVVAPGRGVDVTFTVEAGQAYQSDQGVMVLSPDDAGGARVADVVTVTGI